MNDRNQRKQQIFTCFPRPEPKPSKLKWSELPVAKSVPPLVTVSRKTPRMPTSSPSGPGCALNFIQPVATPRVSSELPPAARLFWLTAAVMSPRLVAVQHEKRNVREKRRSLLFQPRMLSPVWDGGG